VPKASSPPPSGLVGRQCGRSILQGKHGMRHSGLVETFAARCFVFRRLNTKHQPTEPAPHTYHTNNPKRQHTGAACTGPQNHTFLQKPLAKPRLSNGSRKRAPSGAEFHGCPAPYAPHGPCGGTCKIPPISSEAFSSNSGSAPSKKDYLVKRNNDRNGVH
jgi:hypothetical protein